MIKLEQWPNPEKVLKDKLEADMAYRKSDIEPEWEAAEKAMSDEGGLVNPLIDGQMHPEEVTGAVNSAQDIRTSINYIFKHHRLLHSQMSANPPYAGARPLSTDETDKDSAEAAEDTMRWWMSHANLQEVSDQTTNRAIKYGTGFTKTIYNPHKGDMIAFDEEKDEVVMEGDADVYSPSVWDIWIDSRAQREDEVEHVWERKWGSLESWMSIYSSKVQVELLQDIHREEVKRVRQLGRNPAECLIPLYFYYEKGMPRNAMKGRYAVTTREGKLIEEVQDNPHYYRPPMDEGEMIAYKAALAKGEPLPKPPKIAKLPFHILTDIDVDDRVYGRSFIYYEANTQDIINRIDNTQLDNIKAWGAAKLIAQGTGDIQIESINNDTFDVLKVTHSGQIYPLNRPGSLPDAAALRAALVAGGEDAAGVNDAMYGRVERETSASALQMAATQGNQVRRRIFNKYTMYTKSIYQSLLMISKERWDEGKMVSVLGKGGAFKTRYIKSADIDGGYDFVVSYGEQFSLDPAMRRQEIMQLIPILQGANLIKPHQIVELLKINEVEVLHDMNELGKTRAKRIFNAIRKTKQQQPIDKDFEDHDAILEFARYYFMTEEFMAEPEDVKKLMKEHMNQRLQIIASQAPQLAAAPMGAPPPAV
jgi:hypothetical protein